MRTSDEGGREGGRGMREGGRVMREGGRVMREGGEVIEGGTKGVTDITSRLTVHSCRDGLAVEPNSTCSPSPPLLLH